MKRFLLTFGTPDYNDAIKSLIKSSIYYFDEIHTYGPHDIDKEFFNKNKNILNQKRGAGYWLWKPYFIKKLMDKINENDVIFYVDAGNIFINDPNFLFINSRLNNGIILFDNRDGVKNGMAAKNYVSCKKDAFVLMNCDEEKYINGVHLNASYQCYFKNEFSMNFINEYLHYCQIEEIITDTPNKNGENYSGYYDHRHDQSILSLLAIKNDIQALVDPSEWGNKCNCRSFNQLFFHHRNRNFIL